MLPKYERDGDAIYWLRKVDTRSIQYRAEKVSEERTGVHARVILSLQSDSFNPQNIPLLAWSYLNIERAEDRTRLANAAAGVCNGDFTTVYLKEDFRRDLDQFCAGLWTYCLGSMTPEEMPGDPTTEPLSFLLHPYLLEEGGTILFAPPGRGKSYSALLWGVSVDAGKHRFWQVHQAKVLFINLERSRKSVARRLARVNQLLGLEENRRLDTINARGRSLAQVFPVCQKWVREHKTGLVILDSLSRAGLGDLNENQPVNRVVDMLSALCPSWLALGHTSRGSEEHVFGSIMADAGADIIVQLSSQIRNNGRLGIGWEIVKTNDTGKYPMKIWALDFDGGGLTGMRPAREGEFPEVQAKKRTDMIDRIEEYIVDCDAGEADAGEIAQALCIDRANVSRILHADPRFMVTHQEGRKIFYGVTAATSDTN